MYLIMHEGKAQKACTSRALALRQLKFMQPNTVANALRYDGWEIEDDGVHPPDHLARAACHIFNAYPIKGRCDCGYIANVIANEMGLGDGQSNFFHTKAKESI